MIYGGYYNAINSVAALEVWSEDCIVWGFYRMPYGEKRIKPELQILMH